MEYRREIDGLRGLAIAPVIAHHTGLPIFKGGFIGVDVFFVISGYIITSIIFSDLECKRFNLFRFYERRAKRILPALFFVMGLSSILACFWMLPDELKNFGQSLVATTLSANNILLAMTTGYWALASEFKPLLHTWSLGVEEQYYVMFPLLLMSAWRFSRPILPSVVLVLGVISFLAASFGVYFKPDLTFYLLPTRAWEIIAGSLIALHYSKMSNAVQDPGTRRAMAGAGVWMILLSFVFFDRSSHPPGPFMLFPVAGTALVILYASKETIAGRILGSGAMVGLGLISYSAYLWHQPIFAFARVYSVTAPNHFTMILLAFLSIPLAYLTWRFIEIPLRKEGSLSQISLSFSICIFSTIFATSGLHLHKSYGLIQRFYNRDVAPINEIDKKIYNERAFTFKKDKFIEQDKLKILIAGNSFGRDFVNITIECFELNNVEVIYREDLNEQIEPLKGETIHPLYSTADVIVFASNKYDPAYIERNIEFAERSNKHIFYLGSKHFGYNLNWLSRVPKELRPNRFNPLLPGFLEEEKALSGLVPSRNYIPLLSQFIYEGRVPITDEQGYLLSVDREHLTKFGAIYVGSHSVFHSRYGDLLRNASGLELTRTQTPVDLYTND
jgi:peptidoglycan/LPS O-acetylase OafA/YrhL